MTKDELKTLVEQGWSNVRAVVEAIKTLTAEKPFVLFDFEKIDTDEGISQDEMYDLPFAYYVDKHFFYCEGRIQRIEGNDVTMIFTGEEYGEEHQLELQQVPYESLLEVLSMLAERE